MNFIKYLKYRGVVILTLLFIPIVLALNTLNIIDWVLTCPIKHFFNIECLGCGTNRAILLLFKGDIAGSLNQNPLGIIYILLLPILAILDIKANLKTNTN